jgi:hypothetical protein
MDEFVSIRAEVEAGTYRYRTFVQEFRPAEYFRDPDDYLKRLQSETTGC